MCNDAVGTPEGVQPEIAEMIVKYKEFFKRAVNSLEYTQQSEKNGVEEMLEEMFSAQIQL